MSEPYIGEIRIAGFNYAPLGWFLCNGQLLPIQQYSSLFAVIGTIYGGDGQNTFALPNLQGRVPMHPGTGPGLTTRHIGNLVGSQTVTLSESQLPSHSHNPWQNALNPPTSIDPANKLPSRHVDTNLEFVFKENPVLDAAFNAGAIAPVGGGQSHDNMQPYLGLNFIIAWDGYFPVRS